MVNRTTKYGLPASAGNYIQITDGTTNVNVRAHVCTGISSDSENVNVTFYRKNKDSDLWYVVVGSTAYTISTATLNSNERWALKFQGSCMSGYYTNPTGSDLDASCWTTTYIYLIKTGGVYASMSDSGNAYSSTVVRSDTLFTAPTNIDKNKI